MRRGLVGLGGLALAGWVGACLEPEIYGCSADVQCVLDGEDGACRGGFCAYADDVCGSLLRWGPSAGKLAGVCVSATGNSETSGESGGDSGGIGSTGTGGGMESTSGSETTAVGCPDDCSVAPGPCFEAQGSCDPIVGCVHAVLVAGTVCMGTGDSCVGSGVCDAQGNCLGGKVACEDPPACHEPVGTCNPSTGVCDYDPSGVGSDCDDGDGCTIGDACDGAGKCIAGDLCPTDNPCEVGTCSGNSCGYAALADGTVCGPDAADRCCGGGCVDISSNEAHCGGCFTACQSGQSCETVAATNSCSSAPANTSGRCTCPAANDACPLGQICRTAEPFTDRCAPPGPANCAGTFVDLQVCPNFCRY